ncbi:MAG: DNA mismatch repair endonuclease MutL [Puniceicoccales bacterium]|jgi:DNA mismatch repair protein MutL|nr:DNA mismatch repair endonuclease MutL [Puniceicoccales bacterium]
MSKIKILPEYISNQIAAGEVVERPAAVIKELVENSLDANATKIVVRFSAGGKNLIAIEDNGIGMSRVDAELSMLRHATSKIISVEDIQTIDTFGFRGEAIPAIASVSKFLMRTNDGNSEAGTEIFVHAGKIQHVKECGLTSGTFIEVTGLLHSLPARRQFLKSDETETAHIIRVMRAFMLAERKVKFELYRDGKLLFCSPVCDGWSHRASKLYGEFYAEWLFDFADCSGNISVEGALLNPSCINANKTEIVCFVNKRQVLSQTVNRAVRDAYAGFIPHWQGQVAFISLNFPKNTIDVNVHPQKREVRFKNERAVKDLIEKAIYKAIDSFLLSKSVVDISGFQSKKSIASNLEVIPGPRAKFMWDRTGNVFQLPPRQTHIRELEPLNVEQVVINRDLELIFIGTVFGQFAIFESTDGLWTLNLKAASRRVFFEKFVHRQINDEPQCLLLPRVVQMPTTDDEIIHGAMDLFSRYGIVIEKFGKDLCRIDAIPPWLDEMMAEKLLLDVISEVNSGKIAIEVMDREWFAKLASSCINIKNYDEMENVMELVKSLLSSNNHITDPWGNVTLVEISLNELKNKFGLSKPIISL